MLFFKFNLMISVGRGYRHVPNVPHGPYKLPYVKGMEKPRLIGLTEAGFNDAWTSTKTSALSGEPRQVD